MSMLPESLTEAAELLALRATEIQHGVPRMTKQAMEKTAVLEQLGKIIQNLDPAAQKALLGTGIGAGIGLGSSLFREKGKRNPLRNMLTGGLAGGAIGGGLGLASGFKPKVSETASPKGQIEGPRGPMKLKPGKTITPEIAKQLADAEAGSQGSALGIKYPWLTTLLGAPASAANAARDFAKNKIDNSQFFHSTHTPNAIKSFREKITIDPARTTTEHHPLFDNRGRPIIDRNTGRQAVDRVVTGTHAPTVTDKSGLGLQSVDDVAHLDRLQQMAKDKAHTGDLQSIFSDRPVPTVLGRNSPWRLPQTARDQIGREAAKLAVPEALRKEIAEPVFRRSSLHQLSKGRLGQPFVGMNTKADKLRFGLKHSLPLLAAGLGEGLLREQVEKGWDARKYRNLLNEYAEPVKGK